MIVDPQTAGGERRRLIEVALPLDAINAAAAREKSIRHGHPSTLHLWWARRPLAAARAVIFAQLVDDPAEYVDVLLSDRETRRAAERRVRQRRAELEGRPAGAPAEGARGSAPTLADMAAELERERLFEIIENLVQWKSTTNETVLDQARVEIWQSWRRACAQNADSSGNFLGGITSISAALGSIQSSMHPYVNGYSFQHDAQASKTECKRVISTDPPYYDNIGYADLSDFFYVWLRRSLKSVFPDLFATLTVPKAEELVATPYRHGGKEAAELFFLSDMVAAVRRMAVQTHPGFPVTIYYAFKQSETKRDSGTASTGWETFLDAVIQSGFGITGTWPMRTELDRRMIGMGTNALASSIVLLCRRRRPEDAPTATRRECVTALRTELPPALRLLQTGNVAPVDLAQAAIGPGMAVYTLCERKKQAAEALAYNGMVQSWPEISRLAATGTEQQSGLFDEAPEAES